MATAGLKHDEVLRPGEGLPPGALVDEVLRTGETVYRRDMSDHLYPEEVTLTEIGLQLAGRRAAPARDAADRDARDPAPAGRTRSSADELELAALLGRLLASGVQNIRAYESERGDRRRAAPAVGAPGRLRLARLARAAQPDGGRDRRRPDARGALARAQRRPARGVPRPDRRRDEPAGDADRRRPRHVADRGGDLLVPIRRGRRRPSSSATRSRASRCTRTRSRVAAHADRAVPHGARRPRAAAPGAAEPARERRQVLAGRRGGRRPRLGGERPRARHGRGHGPRHPARAARADLRAVRPRQRRPGQARHRPRPVHRPLDRRGARRRR